MAGERIKPSERIREIARERKRSQYPGIEFDVDVIDLLTYHDELDAKLARPGCTSRHPETGNRCVGELGHTGPHAVYDIWEDDLDAP